VPGWIFFQVVTSSSFDRHADICQDVDLKGVRFGPVKAPTAPDRLDELALADRPPDRFDAVVGMAGAVDRNAAPSRWRSCRIDGARATSSPVRSSVSMPTTSLPRKVAVTASVKH
jgi:hypothetical protein